MVAMKKSTFRSSIVLLIVSRGELHGPVAKPPVLLQVRLIFCTSFKEQIAICAFINTGKCMDSTSVKRGDVVSSGRLAVSSKLH